MKKISLQPPGRNSFSPYEEGSPGFTRSSLSALVASLRLGASLCTGGREDLLALRNLAQVGFSSSPTPLEGVSEEILFKVTKVRTDIVKNPGSAQVLPDIRAILIDLEPVCDFVGKVGSPVRGSPFEPIGEIGIRKNSDSK